MFRIRTKLVATLLLVALVPVMPSYLLAKMLVSGFFAIGSNQIVENAVIRSHEMASELHRRYGEEAVDLAAFLAASADVGELLDNGDAPRDSLAARAAIYGPYSLEIYNGDLTRVAAMATIDSADSNTVTSKGFFQRLDSDNPDLRELDSTLNVDLNTVAEHVERKHPQVNERVTQLVEEDKPPDLWGYRKDLALLASAKSARRIDDASDPRFVAVVAPIAGDAFLVYVRLLDPAFARYALQLDDLRELLGTFEQYQDKIKKALWAFFLVFYTLMAAAAGAIGYLISRRLTAPLLRLVEGTKKVADGDLDYRIDVSARDEIGDLMQSFNSMVANIKTNQTLAHEREVERLQLEEEHRQYQEKQARLLLQEKMASMESLVAGVAHELNNPLGAVDSAADVARRCLERLHADDPRQEQALKLLADNLAVIGAASARIDQLVKSLRSFAQLDEAEYQLCDLREGLDSALVLLQNRLSAGFEIEREYAEMPPVYCAVGQINQVFMSVLKNAIEASGDSGRIELRIWSEAAEARVRISDTGKGIAPEHLERIFDFGFQKNDGRVRMGTGLAMAYRIVEAHGGRIEIESEVGVGTQVDIYLPQNASKER